MNREPLGDFNVITKHEENQVVDLTELNESLDFLSCLSDCNVQGGSRFTWSDDRDPPNTIWRRLDRLVFNAEWFDILGYYNHPLVQNLLRSCPSSHANQTGHIKYFKSLNLWTDHEDYLSIMQQAWSDPQAGTPFYSLQQNIKKVCHSLSAWSRTTFGVIFDNSQENSKILEKARTNFTKYIKLQDNVVRHKAGSRGCQHCILP
ncbi:hypothetical protein RDI58_027175 [Solanum bulbocastanum]|uniref:Uncharacterized protein n=1 Tax=Solanum bulbocastanum TaxID=147425 RepID=A0AAN8SVJ2_SOLBU